MTLRLTALGLLATLSLTGCGHGATSEVPGTPATLGGSSAAGSAPREASTPQAATPESDLGTAAVETNAGAPPSAAGTADQVYAPKKAAVFGGPEVSRPGLGTSWGEPVASEVSTTTFARAEGDTPYATATFFYNDESGVGATSRGRFLDWGDSVVPLANGNVTVSLVDVNGRPLRAARSDGRTTALGSDGDRYVVRIDNHSPLRLETVATVDGLDVVDGGDGDLRKRGYVIAPYDTLEIEGFRESEGSVRAFRFGKVSDSYASRTGKDRNVGVVGVALFSERGADIRWTHEEIERRETADPFPAHFAPAPPAPPQWMAR